jgi:hypothetical protein
VPKRTLIFDFFHKKRAKSGLPTELIIKMGVPPKIGVFRGFWGPYPWPEYTLAFGGSDFFHARREKSVPNPTPIFRGFWPGAKNPRKSVFFEKSSPTTFGGVLGGPGGTPPKPLRARAVLKIGPPDPILDPPPDRASQRVPARPSASHRGGPNASRTSYLLRCLSWASQRVPTRPNWARPNLSASQLSASQLERVPTWERPNSVMKIFFVCEYKNFFMCDENIFCVWV